MKKNEIVGILREIGYAGVGAMTVTKDMTEALIKRMAKEGKIKVEHSEKMITELKKHAGLQRKSLEQKINSEMKKMISKAPFATKKEVDELKKKIAHLEKKKKR